ncbi:ROK family protein [Anaerobranca gottschalkii]|uniref:Glucokinase n=1 Tax=Anaerobranca gottschalkii DSM 13577 TaxID=1120990 RepID=A0A1H9ZSS4_9FIRM|nr:ROK family glucokinase [Anaerobranca gottschalkii]SES84390.1 glucokinase [Anaerobranca gottschalkii DSM 13577]
MEELIIGVDLGGTNIAAALVKKDGSIIKKISNPTEANKGKDVVITNLIATIEELLGYVDHNKKIKGIGIGIPGVCDIEKGLVKFAPNLFWENVEIVKILESKFNLPVFIDNDANAAALGEVWCGAGKGKRDIVCITLGTGVGCGIILNGEIFHGAGNGAGELGHITVKEDGPKCNCGNNGCLEVLVAAPAIAKKGKDALLKGDTLLRDITDLEKLTAKDVFDAAKKGDKICLDIIKDVANNLGLAIANVINILNPQMIIIGGGVAAAGDILFKPLEEVVAKRALKDLYKDVEIVPAQLGNDAGIIGAAALVK